MAVKNGTSNLSIVHTDYLTTPRIITSGGSIVWQWKNDNAYGFNQAQGSIEFNLRFAGQYYDSESGFHYNIHRTYNPEFGRYMQSDPLGLAAGFNTYNYAERNPLSLIDPDGKNPVIVAMVVSGVVGGVTNGLNYYSQGENFWSGFWKGAVVVASASLIEIPALSGAVAGAGTQILNRYLDGVKILNTKHPVRDCILEPFLAGGLGAGLGAIFGRVADSVAESTTNAFLKQHLDTYKNAITNAYSFSYTNLTNAYINMGTNISSVIN